MRQWFANLFTPRGNKEKAEALLLLIVAVTLTGITRYQVMDESSWIKATLAVSLLIFLPAALLWKMKNLVLAAATYLMVSVGAAGALLCINGMLDDSEPACHDQEVVMKGGGGRTPAQVTVASWRPGRADEVILISHRSARKIKPGQTILRVCTKRGALGFEWVDSYSLLEK